MNREERNVEHRSRESGGTAAGRIISVIFTVLVLLLLFRVAFTALGANTSNAFVGFIYQITDVMVAPFTGIFGEVDPGTGGTIEPAALIAIIVVAVVGMLLKRLLTPSRGTVVHETNVTEDEFKEPERTVVRDQDPDVVEKRVIDEREVRREDRVAEDSVVRDREPQNDDVVVEERIVREEEGRVVDRDADVVQEDVTKTRRIRKDDLPK